MVSAKTSRELAKLGNTPLSKALVEASSGLMEQLYDAYQLNDGPPEGWGWLLRALKESDRVAKRLFSQDIAEDMDSILIQLLGQMRTGDKDQKKGYAKLREEFEKSPIYEAMYKNVLAEAEKDPQDD